MQYLLLNKDTVWLEFHCEQNEYLETSAREDNWHTGLRPFGYTNLTDFLERRKAPKHRAYIAQLLREYGCDTLEGYLDVAHALSLNDTFWVKKADSALCWKDVSLYRNPFNEVISEAAFDGSFSSSAFSSTSPEFSTDGQYAKCWVQRYSSTKLAACSGWNRCRSIWPHSWLPSSARKVFFMTSVFTMANLSQSVRFSPARSTALQKPLC